MPENRKLRVFLCHVSQDQPIVRELYQKLAAERFVDPWLDEERLLPGQDRDAEIKKAVEVADVVIVFLSNNSVNKEGEVQKELQSVLDIALTGSEEPLCIIPLRLEECTPPRLLQAWQHVDYFPQANQQKAYGNLLTSLVVEHLQIGTDSAYRRKSAYIPGLGHEHESAPGNVPNPNQIGMIVAEWREQVFRIGDRVAISNDMAGTFKPNETGHAREIIADYGQEGTVIEGVRMSFDAPDAPIQVLKVKWDRQRYIESDSKRAVTLNEFIAAIHVAYLIHKGSSR